MDYLKQHNLASAPALLVVSRYLATRPSGEEETTLQRVLQPHAMISDQGASPRGTGARGVLLASLEVGEDIDLLEAQGSRRERRVWSLRDSLRDEVQAGSSADSRPFRSLLLRRLSERAVATVEAGQRPSDVVLALAWLLLRDPLAPLSTTWGDGPETAFRNAGLDATVANAEQWRALVRWARSLGLATDTVVGRKKSYLVVDPTRAIQDALCKMPRRAPADRWFRRLRSLLPVLGDPKLVSALPPWGGASISEVPASTALAMQKLERAERLRLLASDDASSAVVLRLGHRVRSIGEVHVVEEVA